MLYSDEHDRILAALEVESHLFGLLVEKLAVKGFDPTHLGPDLDIPLVRPANLHPFVNVGQHHIGVVVDDAVVLRDNLGK